MSVSSDELVREAREIARHERIAETRDGDSTHVKIADVLTDLATALEDSEDRYEATETARVRLVNAHAAALAKIGVVLEDLPEAVRRQRLARGESIRSAARQIGVHFSILDRFEKRATAANMPTAKRMLAWLATQSTDQWLTAPDGEEFRVGQCQGHAECPVATHEHGCFADIGNCDHPEDHQPSDSEPTE